MTDVDGATCAPVRDAGSGGLTSLAVEIFDTCAFDARLFYTLATMECIQGGI